MKTSRILNHDFIDFDLFYNALVNYVLNTKSCVSVRDNKLYDCYLDNESIVILGEDRAEPSLYSKSELAKIHEILKECSNIVTKTFEPIVGRHQSPILALLVATNVVIEEWK